MLSTLLECVVGSVTRQVSGKWMLGSSETAGVVGSF
jgi:hypothetical protein